MSMKQHRYYTNLFSCGIKYSNELKTGSVADSRRRRGASRPLECSGSVEVRREKKPPRTDWFLPSPSVLSRLFYMRLSFNYCILSSLLLRAPHETERRRETLCSAVLAHTLCTLMKRIIHTHTHTRKRARARLNDVRSGLLDDEHLNACLTRDSETRCIRNNHIDTTTTTTGPGN